MGRFKGKQELNRCGISQRKHNIFVDLNNNFTRCARFRCLALKVLKKFKYMIYLLCKQIFTAYYQMTFFTSVCCQKALKVDKSVLF